jgi:DNA-binding transcriptional ArsR family regulator
MQEDEVIQSLAALAHPLRLRIFRALVVVGPEGMTPGTMTAALDTSPTALSFHLKELAHAGLVSQERAGRNLIYRAAFDRMDALLGYLTLNCCQGQACLPASASPSGCAC